MPDRSVHVRCSVEAYPDGTDRAKAWSAAMSVSAETSVEPQDVAAFSGSLDLYPIGDVVLGDIRAGAFTSVRSRSTLAAWSHNHVIFDAFPQGGFEGHIGGQPVSIGAGDCVMFDLKGTMRIHFRPMRCLALIIPRQVFDHAIGRVVPVDGLVFRAGSPQAGFLGPLLEHAVATIPGMDDAVATAVGLALVNMVAACVAETMPKPPRPSRADTPTLPKLLRFIERHAAEPAFGPEQLCSHFAMSRTALYRLFTSVGGVAAVIRRCRTDLAMEQLGTRAPATRALADVAAASGFADVRSLRRALSVHHHLSPEQVRAAGHPRGSKARIGEPVANLFDEL